ncbi:hypothetical protein [Flavihumibacter fluvii]|uniref:hypothetical protein n=1 Tax=Flavihumibacter fluvii TaxID=2838157 RepID=UPI001BDE9C67|nr:hypothetical protein [Flavihumibacter fluvii]ULQ52353.1 hypothetical protein KJS93_19890 [Flavihumibacter fluvii]
MLSFGPVKKLAAITLIGILLFNWGGYRWVFSYLEESSSQLLNARLDDRNYDEEALITIKLPVENLPYYTNSPIFERVKGEVTIGGMKYQYVEKRIFNDSLEMRCIPNAHATHLTNARDEFFKMVNDLQQTSSSGKHAPAKQSNSVKNTLTEGLTIQKQALFTPSFNERPVAYQVYLDYLPVSFQSAQEQPPDIG